MRITLAPQSDSCVYAGRKCMSLEHQGIRIVTSRSGNNVMRIFVSRNQPGFWSRTATFRRKQRLSTGAASGTNGLGEASHQFYGSGPS
jgi:hypothetical protein